MSSDQEFVSFVKENKARFYRLAFSYVKNSDDALDVVQEAVLKAYEKRHTLRREETMRTWFYRILVNASIDALRRRQRVFCSDTVPEEKSGGGPETAVLDAMALSQALERLSPELKSVVLLRFFEDMKLSEIAQVLGVPLSTVKNRLYRALSLLRIDLEAEEGRELP